MAAEQGHIEALRRLFHVFDQVRCKTDEETLSYAPYLIALGDVRIMMRLVERLEECERYSDAFGILDIIKDTQSRFAIKLYAAHLAKGLGCRLDIDRAEKYYRKICVRDPEAAVALAHLLTTMRNGLSMAMGMFEYVIANAGRKREMEMKLRYVEFLQARKIDGLVPFKTYVQLARDVGLGTFQYDVARKFLEGTDFKRDERKGVEFLKLAADSGHNQAAFEYGKWLIGRRKITSGLHYLEMAGKQDNLEALVEHADALRTYRAGSSRGRMDEFMLLMKAGDAGHREAKARRRDPRYRKEQFEAGLALYKAARQRDPSRLDDTYGGGLFWIELAAVNGLPAAKTQLRKIRMAERARWTDAEHKQKAKRAMGAADGDGEVQEQTPAGQKVGAPQYQ
jgi:TPR repeat protein